ncbi:MAG: anti-sigma factor [Candidatus Eremiobacteraeota bacterium]|nr:anti-sigma factor [Candidatus Eremiobacteraeota bacterium]
MNERHQETMLDDVAVYALGALPAAEARRVREHMATCSQCREEYARLRATAASVGFSAETTADAAERPSTLLRPRVMREVRASLERPRVERPPVWPAYLVAAACLAIAITSSIGDIALNNQLRQAQSQVARSTQRSTGLARDLAETRTTLSDLLSTGARRYPINGGEIVTHGGRLYIAMHELPAPPRGKVYQAWTLAKGAKKVAPSLTFVPDARGVAVVAIPVDARDTAAVAISVEPDGGSKQPTTTPIALVKLS